MTLSYKTDPATTILKANCNLNADPSSKFDTQHFFQSIAKSSTR
jgi:hypothetical protein